MGYYYYLYVGNGKKWDKFIHKVRCFWDSMWNEYEDGTFVIPAPIIFNSGMTSTFYIR